MGNVSTTNLDAFVRGTCQGCYDDFCRCPHVDLPTVRFDAKQELAALKTRAEKAEAKLKELEAEVEAEKGAMRSAIEGMRAYVKGEREARFCTSDAIQDLLDQLFMQCLDHAPEYANFIKAAEEQHAATQGTIAELRANLAGSLEERAALAHEVAEERVEVEHFKARALKAEAERDDVLFRHGALERRLQDAAQISSCLKSERDEALVRSRNEAAQFLIVTAMQSERQRAEKAEAKLKSIGELVVDSRKSTVPSGGYECKCLACRVAKVLEMP